MPCEDLTESIFIALDAEERLMHYVLRKESCGRMIGDESMLCDTLKGMPAEDILAVSTGIEGDSDFLAEKHLNALKSALRAYLGLNPAGSGEPCAISEISCDESGTTIVARIRVDLPTENFKSCGE